MLPIWWLSGCLLHVMLMYLFWHCGGMSCVCLQDDSLFGVGVSVTLKKEAAHSSKTLEQAGCNETECQGTWAVTAIRHFCTLHWVALLSLIFHEFVHPLHCFSGCINPYPTAFPYGNGMVLHFYQQQESSMTKTVHKVINKGLKAYV